MCVREKKIARRKGKKNYMGETRKNRCEEQEKLCTKQGDGVRARGKKFNFLAKDLVCFKGNQAKMF